MMQEGLNEIRFPSAMYLGWNMSREFSDITYYRYCEDPDVTCRYCEDIE
jgi:hypothetical protein